MKKPSGRNRPRIYVRRLSCATILGNTPEHMFFDTRTRRGRASTPAFPSCCCAPTATSSTTGRSPRSAASAAPAVPVHAIMEGRANPASRSRYLYRGHPWAPPTVYPAELLSHLRAIGERIGRETLLVPMDDAGAIFVAEHADALRPRFAFPHQDPDVPAASPTRPGCGTRARSTASPARPAGPRVRRRRRRGRRRTRPADDRQMGAALAARHRHAQHHGRPHARRTAPAVRRHPTPRPGRRRHRSSCSAASRAAAATGSSRATSTRTSTAGSAGRAASTSRTRRRPGTRSPGSGSATPNCTGSPSGSSGCSASAASSTSTSGSTRTAATTCSTSTRGSARSSACSPTGTGSTSPASCTCTSPAAASRTRARRPAAACWWRTTTSSRPPGAAAARGHPPPAARDLRPLREADEFAWYAGDDLPPFLAMGRRSVLRAVERLRTR